MTRELSLDHLTVWEAAPLELVDIAAQTGCRHIGLWLQKPPQAAELFPLVGDTPMRRALRQRLSDRGVGIHSAGVFALMPDTQVENYRGMLESAAVLGARRAIAVGFDPEPARQLERFVALCRLAAEHGLCVDLEFIAFSAVNSLDAALRLLQRAAQANAGLVLDPLHLIRSGGAPADLVRIPPGCIGYAQICDGPLAMPPEQQWAEGSEQRRIPGEGRFPLREYLAALPPELPLGLEIPLKDLAEAGVGALERVRRCAAATRRLLAAV